MEKTLGKVIAERREEIGLTQRKLAQAVHISNATVSRIEGDDNIVPDNRTLKCISEVLKLDYNYLLALNKQIDDDPEIRMIQRAARNMDDTEKEEMLRLLQRKFKKEFESAGGDTGDLD